MEFMQIKKITISTLSPVHIGCDEDYVPTNFVIKDQLLHYLDMTAVADELGDSERAALGKMNTVGSIQQFFKSRRERLAPLASHLVELATGIADEYEEKAGMPTQQGQGGAPTYNLFPIMRTAYNRLDASPYFPGSSLKGSMRTAWLDSINMGKHLLASDKIDKKQVNRNLQQRLLGYASGKFENDPFRHLMIADAHHPNEGEPAPSLVLYAVSKKKRPSERGASELKVFLEAVHGMMVDAFSGELRFTDGALNWENLCDACNDFYFPQLESELEHPHLSSFLDTGWRNLLNDVLFEEMAELRKQKQGFLLRVGKHSGAESVTLNGLRDIKILGKKGEQPSYRPETTEKRFASRTRAALDGLLPFGWVWIECCDDRFQFVSRSLRDKLLPHSRAIREAHRERIRMVEEARQVRIVAMHLKEQQRLQAEEEANRKAEEEAARQAKLAAMSQNLQKIEAFKSDFSARKEQLRGNKENMNGDYHNRARKIAQDALAATDWTQEEKSALADAITEWLPKVVQGIDKDQLKKLKLSALRGQA